MPSWSTQLNGTALSGSLGPSRRSYGIGLKSVSFTVLGRLPTSKSAHVGSTGGEADRAADGEVLPGQGDVDDEPIGAAE